MKLEPEQALKAGNNPDPLTEINFWKKKSENLNSIHQQLQSERVKWILKFLEQSKSTYTNAFAKLQKEVQAARNEANDNFKYLQILEPHFLKLTDNSTDFTTLYELFLPIMHTILMIWKYSKYYNTPPRLVVLIREICNAIITKAADFISGRAIFNMIEEGEAKEACNKLQMVIDICAKFKDFYFEYKAKANGSWKLTTNALFVRLDSFLERCYDILHLTTTYVQFSSLERVDIGGTKGKSLTESIVQIYQEFKEAVSTFQAVHYDIMDISAKSFDADFLAFRTKIKELERRLAAVITQGFDDCDTMYGRFKLLDSFEGLLDRPIIQDELEKKHIVLIESYKQDLKSVQALFLEGKVLADKADERAPLYSNLPPIAGTLTWCQSLLDRIREPIEKLQTISPAIGEREEFKDVQKLYQNILKNIKEYIDSKILGWEKEADVSSQEKLQQFLLRRNEKGLVKVNFDAALIRLLRETRYLLLLGQSVPQSASSVFAKDDTYRSQVVSLDMIVFKYNNIKTCLHPVEEPLVINSIKKMDETLRPGIDTLTWNSANIDKFIAQAKEIVEAVDTVVQKMKGDLEKIKNILHHFDKPLLERKNKPMPVDDFRPYHEANIQNKENAIRQEGQQINRLIKEINEATKADKKSKVWRNYVDYINEIIITGIIKAITTSLNDLNDNINPEIIKRREIPPLFEIRIELGKHDVLYNPEIEDADKPGTLVNLVSGWIKDFTKIATALGRQDGQGDFLTEVRDSFEFKGGLATVTRSLNWLVDEMGKFRQKFTNYNYLWNTDPKEVFSKFVEEEIEREMANYHGNEAPVEDGKKAGGKTGSEEDEFVAFDDNLVLLRGASAKIPRMSKFDQKIAGLKSIQQEIDSIKTPHEIGWLKIDVQPLKSALNVKTANAIKMYTDFLHHQVKQTLSNLREFVRNTNQGIKRNPAEEEDNTELLMSVMKTIAEVRLVEEGGKTEKIVRRLKDVVTLLKAHNVHLEEDYLNSIDAVYTEYYETSRKVFDVKAAILPLINREKIAIKKRLDQFAIQVQEFRNDFLRTLPYNYDEKMEINQINACYDLLGEYFKKLCVIEAEAREYENLENLFELEQTNYKQLKDCKQDLKNLKIFWDACAMVTYTYNNWKQKSWKSIKSDVLQETNKVLSNQIKTLPKEIRNFKGYSVIEKKVKNMQTLLPLISSLHSEFMEHRHWQEIIQTTGKEVDPTSPSFCFNDILEMELYNYETAVNEIVDKAQKEAKIDKKLKQIKTNWDSQIFEFIDEKEYETKLFLSLDTMKELLDANQMDLMGMMSQGKYVEHFKDTVEDWREKLKMVDTVTTVWLKVQKNWRRLVNIFVKSEDIRVQLPDDTKKFEALDKDFRDLMIEASQSPEVVPSCNAERKTVLDEMMVTLEQCEKALNEYLGEKKKAFPRFYFVSDQALLDILSNGNNPHKVAEYLADCFDGMKDLNFNVDANGQKLKSAKGMYSKENEYVPFSSDFVAEGAVETWLSNLEFKMRATLAEILEHARGTAELWEVEVPREEWLKPYCAQLALVTTQIIWTEEVNRAFDDLEGGSESAMKEYLKQVEKRIDALIIKVRGDLDAELRTKIITIITIDVHSRDVVEKFVNQKLTDKESFAWQSQLKLYWEKSRDNEMASKQNLRFPWEKDKEKSKCVIRIVDWAKFYSYEYVGNCGRLVITPLTDRCYITLTQALNLYLGGAPAGPAGTGKTETTKDLGRAVGLPVMVFNCSDQMNYNSMAQIFMGLAQTGAWGCFDEFNRISIEVLSVVSTQVAQVLDALKERKTKFLFMDKEEISLVDTVGFFITMNPGYAGRTELPENLKALFRSCAMVVPDLVLICENMLMSEGFALARALSRKFVTLYDLSKSLLSKQMHYDWGLRAIKSVLRQAGKLKRGNPDLEEDPLLKKALRDFNMPKIALDDRQIFLNLLDDLFPGVHAPEKLDVDLKKLVMNATKERGYIAEDMFALKCVQLSEILEVRHCCFVIGSPGCGKTTIWKTLAQTYINRGQDTLYEIIDPKAISADELYGYMTKTKEWRDGVLSNIMRNQSKNLDKYKPSHAWKFVILDGDIDPEWIESLNTVMDDNKLLTLVSNERIFLTPAMRLLFEISNLKNATPATVSRGGVLFVNEQDVGWKPYMDAWIERSIEKKKSAQWQELNASPAIDDIAKSVFYNCFQTYFEGNAEISKYSRIAPVNDIIMVQTTCAIIDALLEEYLPVIKQLEEEHQKTAYHAFYLFAAMWAVGGSIGGQDDDKDLRDFNNVWKANAKIKYPEGGLCLDYYFDPQKLAWAHWNTRVESYVPAEEVTFSKIYVPTVQTVRLKYLLNQHVMRKRPLLFAGPAGNGKTAVVKDYISGLNPEKRLSATFNFNSFTDSAALQRNIESRVEKKSGRTYGLPANKLLIYFIDDLNMPFVDKYGTQTPIALLRQLIDYSMVYDRDHLDEKKFIEDLLFISCLNPKSGSFTVNLRLQRHFSLFTMSTPTLDILKTIYCQILSAHLSQFDQACQKISDKLIDATIAVFNKILKDTTFSPSAKKFHYQFNLREISKVVEGLMMSNPNAYRNNPSKLIKLWVHESKRVFEDRLINMEDITRFNDHLKEGYKFLAEDDKENAIAAENNLFTSFIAAHYGNDKSYVPIDDMPALKKVLEEKLVEYNEVKAVMNLVLFDQAMEHITRICRILEQPAGHCLLVGVGGSGKQSLSKLSAFIVGLDIDQIVVSQNYTLNDLKTFLQELIKKCVKTPGNPRAFMLTDSQIQDEYYLVFVNDLLSSGFIPDLFPKDELDGIVGSLRNEAKGAGYPDNYDGQKAYFLDKLKRNLHLILAFSPVGEKFRVRARKFPGIINSTMINWFHGWPKTALIDVANRFLEEVELPTPEMKEAIALNMAEVHGSIDEANKKFLILERRYNYTTPKSFLELIDFYKKLLTKKREYIVDQIQRLENGLLTLAQTQTQVKGLQENLKEKMKQVEEESKKTEQLIDKVMKESEIAEAESQVANEQKNIVNALTEAANKKAEEANKALEEALPALEQAKEAVKGIEKSSITEMKSLPTPPPLVQVVAKAILILITNDKMPANEPIEKTWKKAVTIMGDPGKFLKTLLEYKGENIEENKLEQIRVILANPENLGFDFAELKKKNTAAAFLGKWLTSMIKFNHVYKIVAPLDEAKRAAEEEVALKSKELAVVVERARKVNERVADLKRELDEAVKKKQAVEEEAQRGREKLEAAEKLVHGLAGENKRWGENVKKLKENTLTIIGDVLLSAAFVSYIGAFSAGFRKDLWQGTWIPDINARNIPMTQGVEPLKILTNESAIAQWKNEGLPADQMSLENASVITSCQRWPLIIDPQLQGSNWIKGAYGGELITFSLNQDKWMNKLINAIQMGKTVLIESVGQEIDATLEPLLSRAIIKKGRNYVIELGGDPVDYDPKFKLFLQTKLSNPHFKPEIAAQCTIINFIVTEGGLEDQLLAMVVKVERPELESEKSELVRKQNEFQVQLAQLEENLLNALSEADPATILDNKALIESLDNTKKTAIEIEIQSKKARETEAQINVQREIYRKVAAEGATLYFLIISLNFIDHMYQYSLEAFTTFFFKAIERTLNKDENRIEDLRKNIRYTVYQWVSRGLFERHKLIFLSLITFRLMQKKIVDVQYDPTELQFLLNAVPKPVADNPLDWLSNEAWGRIQRLIDLEEFKSFAQNVEKDAPSRFKDWYNELAPEDAKLPLDWKKLDAQPFRKLLVLRCMRPDRITAALTSFIRGTLPDGTSFVEMDQKSPFSEILSSSLDDSTPNTPIFFILSTGADPVKDVEALAKKKGFEKGKNFWDVALGQGQDVVAMEKLERGHKEGHWVMLQNVHLMPKWLIELEKKLDQFAQDAGGTNANFRLFLSAEPSTGIPIGLLDRCIKLTNEPPAGLKANMKRAWSSFRKEEIEERDPRNKTILFALCYFHSTLLERRKFGAKGWNMFYPFNAGDLRDSSNVLNKTFEGATGKIPWADLSYIFGEIMYGGHIVDDWDRRLCKSYLEHFMNDGLLDELDLFPYVEGKGISFRCPTARPYDKYIEYIEQTIAAETPLAYGLHPNAEIGFRTTQCDYLFSILLELQPKETTKSSSSSDEGAIQLKSKNEV